MGIRDRDMNQAKFTNLYLGKNTKEIYQPIIEQIKNDMQIKPFVMKALELYHDNPNIFKE